MVSLSSLSEDAPGVPQEKRQGRVHPTWLIKFWLGTTIGTRSWLRIFVCRKPMSCTYPEKCPVCEFVPEDRFCKNDSQTAYRPSDLVPITNSFGSSEIGRQNFTNTAEQSGSMAFDYPNASLFPDNRACRHAWDLQPFFECRERTEIVNGIPESTPRAWQIRSFWKAHAFQKKMSICVKNVLPKTSARLLHAKIKKENNGGKFGTECAYLDALTNDERASGKQ